MVVKRSQHGFTLIELLLYVAIVGSLLLSVSLFFGLALESRVKNQSVSEVDQQGLFIMDTLTQAVRSSSAIANPTQGATGSSLELTMPTAALSPTIFSSSGGVISIKEGSGSGVPLSNNLITVSNLTFKNLSRPSTPGVVQISFTLSRINPSNANAYDYQKTFTTSTGPRL